LAVGNGGLPDDWKSKTEKLKIRNPKHETRIKSKIQMIQTLGEVATSVKTLLSVIPAEAGIQFFKGLLDSRLRGSDDLSDFSRTHQAFVRIDFVLNIKAFVL